MKNQNIYMERAIELAQKGAGYTSPNPMVGAVIVKNRKIIGEGYYAEDGKDHAEVIALKDAGNNAKNATMYVTLEPHSFQGKTAPCTGAIVGAGIRKVHMAMLDPNPRVAGSGKKILDRAGIETVVGECAKEAQELNKAFTKYITTGFPFVALKWAMTLDGKLATKTGDSSWITGEEAQAHTHLLRHMYDAILIGVDTVLTDDPELTVRHGIENPSHPVRVIVDSTGRTPLTAKILSSQKKAKTIIATTDRMSRKKETALREKGTEVLHVASWNNHVDLRDLFEKFGSREITSVLVEGGGKINSSVIERNLADELYAFVGPKIVGGQHAITPVEGVGVGDMSNASGWNIRSTELIGNNILINAYPNI